MKGNYITLNSSFGLGLQAFQVWIKFRLVKFTAKRLGMLTNPILESVLSMGLKEIYSTLLMLRDYSKRTNQLIELPDIDLVG